MNRHTTQAKRRRLLLRGLRVTAAGVLAVVGAVGYRIAAAKMAKDALLYQDHPHDGKRCADCKFFTKQGAEASTGICAIVDGTIASSGWCTAFSRRT